MSEKLNPCPFCGNENVTEDSVGFREFIHCNNCGTDGPSYYLGAFDQTSHIRKWNKRISNDLQHTDVRETEK